MCCQRGYRETTLIPLGIGRETNKLKRRFEDASRRLRNRRISRPPVQNTIGGPCMRIVQ